MRRLILAAVLFAAMAGGAAAQTPCPAFQTPHVVVIHGSTVAATRKANRDQLIAAVRQPNTIVRMTPDVDFDFSDVSFLPIEIGRCTTLTSVADTGPVTLPNVQPRAGAAAGAVGVFPPILAPARSSHAFGPVLRYGRHNPPLDGSTAFLEARCTHDAFNNEGVRVSGFRLYGPTFADQTTSEVGFRVEGCHDTEVSNMEIAGWGGAGFEARDKAVGGIPAAEPAGGIRVLVHDSYFHDNRHKNEGAVLGTFWGHALGYGVVASEGGFLEVFQSVFDNNRHAIAANGKAGGYHAELNLILKSGGFHGAWYESNTHIMDAHGTGCIWSSDNCGDAGRSFLISENVIQYTRGYDINFRGNPKGRADIVANIFARPSQDEAIKNDNDNVHVSADNAYNVDDFGKYDVCDFDGDGVDDLFFATGRTWWFSGRASFPWTFLKAEHLPRSALRLGYFDGDGRCDVLAEVQRRSGVWFVSSGGVTRLPKTPLGSFGHPLAEVVFGRFDPNVRDPRPGATRQTTHAFWRRGDGQWFVTPLNTVAWAPVFASNIPLSQLKFGDFTGDGVTDVLAVVNGHWAISDAARGPWRQINTLGDPVGPLMAANMDADDNVDDLLKLDRKAVISASGDSQTVTLTWWRSKNGTEPWKVWKTYTLTYPTDSSVDVQAGYAAFAGRLGLGPGQGATMFIDQNRRGQFAGNGGQANWRSYFKY